MKIRERDRDISSKEKIVLTLKNKTKQNKKQAVISPAKTLRISKELQFGVCNHGGPSESPCPASKGKRMLLQRGKGSGSGASQVALVVKNPPANARDVRDTGFFLGLGRSAGGGHGNPLWYSCLGESHGQRIDSQSWTQLNNLACTHTSKEVGRTPRNKISVAFHCLSLC